MKKFTCGHCGGRIAVTPRNLGKLVLCPECGKATHPLAADILAAAGDAHPGKSNPPTPVLAPELFQRSCENCGRQIGRLEPLQVWDNHLVCPECHTKLVHPTSTSKSSPKLAKPRNARDKTMTLSSSEVSGETSLVPVVVERTAITASRPARDGVSIDTAALRVAVGRVTSAASAVASLPPLQLKHRLLILLGIFCFAGVAIYGALTLLRDLAGLITTIALVLLAATAVVALMKTGLGIVGKYRSMPKQAPASTPGDAVTAIVTSDSKP